MTPIGLHPCDQDEYWRLKFQDEENKKMREIPGYVEEVGRREREAFSYSNLQHSVINLGQR